MIVALDGAALGLLAILLASAILRTSRTEYFEAEIRTLQGKLDLLLAHAGVEYDPYANTPDSVVEAVRRGQTIQAIKLYRQATGAGLKFAKDHVEGLKKQRGW